MAELKDPANDRVVKTLPTPYQKSLSKEQLFKGTTIDWILVRDFYKR